MALEFLFSGIGSSIVGEIFGSAIGGIRRQLGYLTSYKTNVKNLEEEAENLKDQKNRMDKLVKAARDNGEEIFDDVKRWQQKVDNIYREAKDIVGDENHVKIKCTFSGVFLNVGQRYRLSRKAKKMSESIVKIKDNIKFDNISTLPKLKSNLENKDFVSFDTRNETMRRITKALGDINIGMIGVHGMPGSGKTTLVQEITRRVLDQTELFKDAVMVTVSKSPDHKTIQQQVARKLDLHLDNEESISERADRLKDRLKSVEKLLIILDDVWIKLNLEDVGIVFKSNAKGCKIMLTSRFERLLGSDMGVDENFSVGLLSPDEAWDWFRNIVGHDLVKDDEFQRLGKCIIEECGRLPIAIKIIAHEMKGRDLPSWSDALEQLRRSNLTDIKEMHEKVYSPIKLSFKSLQKDAQSLFLLCGVLQQHSSIKIEDLVRYAFGWDMFESSYTSLQGARNRVHRLINELKDCCMLLDGHSHDTVRLHDLVHDVGIWFAKEKFMYCFKDGAEVEERLRRNALEDSVAIFLPNDYVNVHLLCQTLEYKELGIIRMPQNESLQIPDHFFKNTRVLRVLDLWYSHKLPSSLCSLGNLSTLCLRYAGPELVAPIGELQKLEILDLSWSKIKELPSEIEQLIHLRILDLRCCTQLEVIPPSVIQHLASLEELYVENSFNNWDQVEVVHNIAERRNASLMELQHLAKFTTLHLDNLDVKMLPKDLSFRGNLERYKISIGHATPFDVIDDCSRCLAICGPLESSDLLQERLQMFLKKPQALYLNLIDEGINEILYELSEKGYPELKKLGLKRNNTIRCLIKIHQPARSVFCMLESLHLDNLRKLTKICDGEVTKESFQRLRDIEVCNCNRLKNLLPSSIKRLEKLKVVKCDGMEEIVEYEDDNEEVIGIFPQLLSLSLIHVPKLSQCCSKLKKNGTSRKGDLEESFPKDSVIPFFSHKFVSLPALNKLELYECNCKKIWDDPPLHPNSFRNLTILIVEKCHFMKSLFPLAVAASFEQLESLRIEDCEEMEEIVSGAHESIAKISFPRLNRLILRGLPKLTAISISIFIDFPALTILFIQRCHDLKTLQENSMATALFNEKVSFPSLEIFRITSSKKVEMLWQNTHGSADSFCKLKEVYVSYCSNLVKMFPFSMRTRLGNLRNLDVVNCERLQEVFEVQIISNSINNHDEEVKYNKLERVCVVDCPSLKSIFPVAFAKGLFGLQLLRINNCGIEEIVGKEEGLETVRPYEFVFPQLKKMSLMGSRKLESFYRGPHTSRFPLLTKLEVEECFKMKGFLASELSSFQGTYGSLFFTNNFFSFPKLEVLNLTTCKFEMICDYPLFPCLTELKVVYCHWMKNLFSSATAAVCFKQLCSLEVRHCEMMEEILMEDETTDEMSFPKLKDLSLKDLPNLTKFSSQNFIEFRICTSLRIKRCRKFKTLVSKSSQGKPSNAIPMSLFNEKVAFPSLKLVDLHGLGSLETIWQHELVSSSTADSFCKLEEINIENCKNLTKIFPCTLQRRVLQNLKWLTIRDCEMVEEIFEILISNPDDHQETLTFPNLISVEISACPTLKSIFPTSVAKGLSRLGGLEIEECGKLEEIVGKDEGLEPTEFVFPQLQTLKLQKLPNLVSF